MSQRIKAVPAASPDLAGRKLAVDLLRELGKEWEAHEEQLDPEASYEQNFAAKIDRAPTTLCRYLATASAKPELERGFFCVLNEYLGAHVAGCPREPESFISAAVLRARLIKAKHEWKAGQRPISPPAPGVSQRAVDRGGLEVLFEALNDFAEELDPQDFTHQRLFLLMLAKRGDALIGIKEEA